MTLKLILEVIVAIPTIIKALQSFFKTVWEAKESSRQSSLGQAIDAARVASTPEAAKAANEQVTRNLP